MNCSIPSKVLILTFSPDREPAFYQIIHRLTNLFATQHPFFPKPKKQKMQIQTLFLATLALCGTDAAVLRRAGNSTTSASGADFGSCTPTIDFQLGRAEFNRKATEGTFFPTDPTLVASTGQSDALNPNIITTFVCNQLTNVCGANDVAKSTCASAKEAVSSLTAKDQTTADAFNQALGF